MENCFLQICISLLNSCPNTNEKISQRKTISYVFPKKGPTFGPRSVRRGQWRHKRGRTAQVGPDHLILSPGRAIQWYDSGPIYLTSVCFLLCEMGVMTAPTSADCLKSQWAKDCEAVSTVWHTDQCQPPPSWHSNGTGIWDRIPDHPSPTQGLGYVFSTDYLLPSSVTRRRGEYEFHFIEEDTMTYRS